MGMTKSQLDYIDGLAEAVREGRDDMLGGLSTGERIYAALAANRADDTAALMDRWERR